MNKLLLLPLLTLAVASAVAQVTFPYNGISDQRDGLYAFTNATIFKSYNQKLDNATLVIRKGRVEAVGVGVKIPAAAVVVDCSGKTIYPAFIDLFTSYGLPENKPSARERGNRGGGPQMLSSKAGSFAWNEALKPEYHAVDDFRPDQKSASEYCNLGFGAVMTHQPDGISRGTSAVVCLGEDRPHELVVNGQAGHVLSFRKGSSTQDYPSSLIGSIALLRQTYYDGRWYAADGKDEEYNRSLQAWNEAQKLVQFFDAEDVFDILRAARLGREFGVSYIVKGTGDEYQRLEELKSAGVSLIVPLNFPAPYDVENPFDALQIALSDMKHWELAPYNLAMLSEAGIEFALTTAGLRNKADFWTNLRTAIRNGLSEEAALKALTHNPANMAGLSGKLGSLDPGKTANFLITNGNIFGSEGRIYQNWVQGKPFIVKGLDNPDLPGMYDLQVGAERYTLELKGKHDALRPVLKKDTTEMKSVFQHRQGMVDLQFSPQGGPSAGAVRLTGSVGERGFAGRGQLADGSWVDWQAVKQGEAGSEAAFAKTDSTARADAKPVVGQVVYPFAAFGWKEKPRQESTLFRNATVWTNEKEGILPGADVLIQAGKIVQVGKNLKAPAGAAVVDATGRHLTSGVIDEHTHIAITRGVNEGTQASSAEVRIGDALNSEDINIYRQLSGGVTTAQCLHGSANPIGGQSAIIKLRWGAAPEALKLEGADPFIKFALGENVKQSNWGDNQTVRFPQTRMGVEQVYEDYFTRAREYGNLKKSGKPYRIDLELETLLEILESHRFITCHSYRQSEINMLMKVAERFGFRVNTFTHILEGYKVADIMARHGVGGSSFADWWAYKFEVYEAIPYNGALMHRQGVTVAYNSDDAEMARRLNQEAAKAVKYGGVSEEEAWKFVTLNPAKLLHLDKRLGSIKPGKDADLVLWSDNPLSVKARADLTFVDGIRFFDRERDQVVRQEVATERNRLVQKMLIEKKKTGKSQPVEARADRLYHCDDTGEE
jgi:imidazolonepropionase-like amidohydrolase